MPDRKKTLKEFDRITSVLVDALILLQDQPDVVFCKDCKHGGTDSVSYPQYWCSAHSEYHGADWFCADGEMKG